MRSAQLLALSGMAAGVTAWRDFSGNRLSVNATNSPAAACSYFKEKYANMTLLPEDEGYQAENQVSWTAGAWLGPACILTPASAEQMSCAVKDLVRFETPFAMRGGGHMPIPEAANINSTGILISSTKLDTLTLSEDKNTLEIGPGPRWGEAYIYLDDIQSGKMVVGGRYAPVGVPGYLLGGGMSFFSYEYGFSSTNGNIQAYECVLADGRIVEANATNEFSDLYWALQGGGNSFCLVTKFKLRTFDHTGIGLAMPSYGFGDDVKDAWLTSVLNYVHNGSSDPKAAIIPVARMGAGFPSPRYDATLFHNSINQSTPPIFSDFQGGLLPAVNGTAGTALNPLTMGRFSRAVLPAFQPGGESNGLQQRFHVVSHKPTKEAMTIVHDTFFDAIAARNLTSLNESFYGLAWNSITARFIEVSNTSPNPMGIAPEPVFWVEQAYSWGDAADSETIDLFVREVNANITTQLQAINATSDYIYFNDADPDQRVFEGYPAENVRRLKEIRAKYDPARIYTDLMPGGFKVEHTPDF